MSTPLLSIVIPSFNQGEYIEETIKSILDQPHNDVEILILDGGSTDQTVEIIKKYQEHIAYWQSKKDNGQSDAINQGFKRAKGEFVTWLNSDDVLLPNSITHILEFIKKNKSDNFFLGNVVWMNKEGNVIQSYKVEPENRYWNSRYLLSNGGPSAFIRKTTLEQIGYLREDFFYMMDTDLWYRLIATGNYFKRIPIYVWGLRLHEKAKMSGHNFNDSPLANPNHPSWIKKRHESNFINENYPINKNQATIWRFLKLFSRSAISRLTDKHLIGKHYSQL